MSWITEQIIDDYQGEYKKGGILGKKCKIKLYIYPSTVEGYGFDFYDNKLSSSTEMFEISYSDIKNIYIADIENEAALFIEYKSKSLLNSNAKIVLLGITDLNKWFTLLEETKNKYILDKENRQRKEIEAKEERYRLEVEKEEKALKFYSDCYEFHIQENTPTYQLFSDKNKVALIYIDDNRALNFLKIDGYSCEENVGIIPYENLHYYEKAGNVSYATDIHGNYASFGGSMTGGKFSKLATVGGGLLFGFMGMALGAALTYKPAEQKPTNTTFTIDSDIKKIDDRSVILNFYSNEKKQYIDIELPQDIYNFLQTYIPEKKYGIVDELEKKTVLHQSMDIIEDGRLLKVNARPDTKQLEVKSDEKSSMDIFKEKLEKLKMMKEADILTEEEFKEEKEKLLKML